MVVFIVVQTLVGIDAVVSIICKAWFSSKLLKFSALFVSAGVPYFRSFNPLNYFPQYFLYKTYLGNLNSL